MKLARSSVGRWFAALVGVALVATSCSGDDDSGATTTPPSDAPSTTVPTTEPPATTTSTTLGDPAVAAEVVVGAEEVVYDWSDQPCGPDMHPDLPTKAFRSPDGTVNLIVSSPSNYRLTGPDFDNLSPDCAPIRTSAFDIDPGNYRFSEWIGAIHTADGMTIHAVIHNEFYGDEAAFASSERDFDEALDLNGWSYVAQAGAGLLDLEPGEQERRGPGFCSVSWWGAHPDVGCDPVRRWVVPADGEYTVGIATADRGIGGGDGVDVGLDLDGTSVWTLPIEEGESDSVYSTIEVAAVAGQTFEFWVNARGDASFDATGFAIDINPGAPPCTLGDRSQCFESALTASVSTDGGATFSSPEPNDHLVAAVPQVYVPDGGSVGLWQPSNIVAHPDGYFYMMVQRDIHDADRNLSGMCLLRTDDLADPSAWRAFDGDGFGYEFIDPYTAGITGPGEPCASVVRAPGWSLTYSSYLERFVLLTELNTGDAGVGFLTSVDLVTWSEPQPLLYDWKVGWATGFGTPFEAYPSLIDPSSPDASFTTIGQSAFVYYTRINSFSPNLDYDLLRVPVTFELANG